MNYTIQPAEMDDLPIIQQLFEEAITFQKKNHYIGWENYDLSYIKADIQQKLLFKIIDQKDILCIFSVCYKDPLIWREKDNGNALYLHRVVLNRAFQGQKLFKEVLQWAVEHASMLELTFIRMDTWADNQKIIDYYIGYGFLPVEVFQTPNSPELPIQHRNLKVILLELNINNDLFNKNDEYYKKVNLTTELAKINQYWNQQIIGHSNGQLIKLAKGKGSTNWHKHDDQDELFLVLNGQLNIQLSHQSIHLKENELFIVPKGVLHCPKANEDVSFLIMGLNITSNKAGGQPDWAASRYQ